MIWYQNRFLYYFIDTLNFVSYTFNVFQNVRNGFYLKHGKAFSLYNSFLPSHVPVFCEIQALFTAVNKKRIALFDKRL